MPYSSRVENEFSFLCDTSQSPYSPETETHDYLTDLELSTPVMSRTATGSSTTSSSSTPQPSRNYRGHSIATNKLKRKADFSSPEPYIASRSDWDSACHIIEYINPCWPSSIYKTTASPQAQVLVSRLEKPSSEHSSPDEQHKDEYILSSPASYTILRPGRRREWEFSSKRLKQAEKLHSTVNV